MNKTKITIITVLLLIFALSVWVRIPNINQPLGKHHDWITAHLLMTLKIWDNTSAADYHYSPVYTFNNPGDKALPLLGGLSDKNRSFYYVSYPPFAWQLPYILFKMLRLDFKPLPLQIFSLLLHFITAFFIYLTINFLYNKKLKDGIFLPSLLGFTLYLFATANLWFHANIYFVDILAQPFFVMEVYLFLLIIFNQEENRYSKYLPYLLGTLNFFTVYTEWLGLFIASTMFLICLVKIRQNKSYLYLSMILAATTLASAFLILYQYSSINGFDSFINTSINRFSVRSGYSSQESAYGWSISNPDSYRVIKEQYLKGYEEILYLIGIFSILFLLVVIIKRKFFFNKREALLLAIVAIPVILHHVVFFNFNVVHDFSGLKTSVIFIVILSILSYKIIEFIALKIPKFKWIVISPLLLLVVFQTYQSVKRYLEINNPKQPYNFYEIAGRAIHSYTQPDEAAYINALNPPEMMYYAEHNPEFAKDVNEGIIKMKSRNISKGIFFYVSEPQALIIRIVRFNENGDSLVVK